MTSLLTPPTDTALLRWYLLAGFVLLLTRRRPRTLDAFLSALMLMLFWPVVPLRFWARRQRAVWRTPIPHAVLWLHDVEAPGVLRVGRFRFPLRWRHRRVMVLGPLTFLLRPRPTLDAPILLAPGRVILTPLVCQVQVLWRSNTAVPNRALF